MKATYRPGRGLAALSLSLALLLAGCTGEKAPASSAGPSQSAGPQTGLSTAGGNGSETSAGESAGTGGSTGGSATTSSASASAKPPAAQTKATASAKPSVKPPVTQAQTTASTTKTTAKPVPPSTPVQKKNVLLTYVSGGSVKKEAFRASVGYMKDGKIVDTLYDSILLLPAPDYVYYGDPNNKAKMQKYIDRMEFGSTMDALNEAVGEVKAATGKSSYKVDVYMTILAPEEGAADFGGDRFAGVKWMIDESAAKFKAKNYPHLQIGGFYWFHESINVAQDKEFIQRITAYVHSLSYKSVWMPYYKANGYTEAKTLGFDLAFMQANYFPGTDFPNAGGIDRIASMAALTKRRGMGAGLELSSATKAVALSGFKEYLKYGCDPEVGFMDRDAGYYMSSGAPTVQALCDSRDAYARSAYDELYQFIKGTLTKDKISIK